MFRGSSYHTLDAKGRIIIPARFRDVIRADGTDGLMISRMDSCLLGFPFNDWRKIEAKILAMAEKNENMRRFRRVFIGGAFECTCDKQDRILVPPSLRQYAGNGPSMNDSARSRSNCPKPLISRRCSISMWPPPIITVTMSRCCWAPVTGRLALLRTTPSATGLAR